MERGLSLELRGIDLEGVAKKAAKLYGIEPHEIFIKSRIKRRANAGALYCYCAVNELGISLSELAARLEMTPAGIGYARQRVERIVQMNDYDLLT